MSYLQFRRLLDVVGAAGAIVVLSPALILAASSIRLTMGSPVLFRQRRVGHKGEFDLIKFRTMVPDAEQIGAGYMSQDLIPPVGEFLRRWSLDELPQLTNILRGDMSFIGPRPALPGQVERYSLEQRERLNVPQGLTGLAQVRHRNEAPWSVRIETDREYIGNLGFLTDVRIVALTIRRVITGSGIRMDQTPADNIDDLGKYVFERSSRK